MVRLFVLRCDCLAWSHCRLHDTSLGGMAVSQRHLTLVHAHRCINNAWRTHGLSVKRAGGLARVATKTSPRSSVPSLHTAGSSHLFAFQLTWHCRGSSNNAATTPPANNKAHSTVTQQRSDSQQCTRERTRQRRAGGRAGGRKRRQSDSSNEAKEITTNAVKVKSSQGQAK